MTSILVISEKYYPFSGAELVIHEVVKILRSHGFKVKVITGQKKCRVVNGVSYTYFPPLDVHSKIELWANIRLYESYFKKWILSSDIVYIPRLSYPLIPIAKKLGKKVIVHLLDLQPVDYSATVYHPYENYKRNVLFNIQKTVLDEIKDGRSIRRGLVCGLLTPLNRFCKLWLLDADAVICECKRIAQIIRSEIPMLKKVSIVGNPLPNVPFVNKIFKKDKYSPMFLYGGGTEYCKGLAILVKASISLHKKYPLQKYILTRINDPKWKSFLIKLNRRFDELFVVFGDLKHEVFFKMHRFASALIMPTLIEEFPMIVLESMLAGTIPIASNTGGIPEMVKNTFAEKVLFTPGSVDELIDRMELVISLSEEQIIDIGLQLRSEILKKYSREYIAEKLINIFEA